MTFKDISLIDTALTTMLDFWVTPDGAKQYLLTTDGDEVSLWRKAHPGRGYSTRKPPA